MLLCGVGVLLGLVGGAAWMIRQRLVLVTVHGISMAPQYLSGDRLLVRRAGLATVRRGEVVVFDAEFGPLRALESTNTLLVKRAVALPGDRVPTGVATPDEFVPPGQLVVLGDNASHSYDSRAFGYFTADALLGVVVRPIRGGRRTQWRT